MTRLLDPLFRTDAMREIFSDRGRLQGMLDFEAALARAEARLGVIPKAVTPAIEAQCQAKLFDIEALARAAATAGNTAIPMVKALTALVGKKDKEAADFVHWGATSQDAMDTGLVLQLRSAFDLIDADLARLADVLARLAKKHKRTPMAGRTWLQQAVPVTLGLKVAGALSAVERHRARLSELRAHVLVIQFGGAAGSLASLGDCGLDIAKALAAELKLGDPDIPWHAHRDRVAEVATTLGLLVGTLGKIAHDVALMMQTEVGETFEPAAPGRGGSSTLPHKRNPVGCAVVLAAATKVPALVSVMLAAMVQEHERGLGNWHAEWETLPEICMLSAGALEQLTKIIEGLQIDAVRMRHNLDATHGLILAEAVSAALAPKLGREAAHGLIEEACRRAIEQNKPLRDVLAKDAKVRKHLSASDLDRLFDPANYLGISEQFVERVLATRTHWKKQT
ncbi:MAG: 3-carboxy-cis,cis-muconate cycloisomerase [Betaproteobacteria bacterium]|nr:3-carboxy-cis,cis-muconate cycloisomerase [Betaproteobacteria bacterium]